MNKKFPASLPRRRYWNHELAKADACPECGGPLEAEYHAYFLVVQQGKSQAPFLTGNEGGRFCKQCPVVVLDTDVFAKTAAENSDQSRPPFAVAGIVDLDAVPKDKQDLPFGDDNPVPLVEFLNVNDAAPGRRAPVVRDAPKIGRNDPCPCGSGKKFKKCCGA